VSAVYVSFNLIDKKKKNDQSEEEMNNNRPEIDQGAGRDLLFNVLEDPSGVDHMLCKEFQTDCGVWELTFVPYSDAVQATIQVSLPNLKTNTGLLDVFAKVTTHNSELRDCAEVSLLSKLHPCESFSINCNNGGFLPLSRSVIVAPYGSLLDVNVGIWLCPNVYYVDQKDHCIVNETAIFRTLLFGKDRQCIRCHLGEVEIQITWFASNQS
jgi:hypothetical protein